jgi:hypothetical protein
MTMENEVPINMNMINRWVLSVTILAMLAGCKPGTDLIEPNPDAPKPVDSVNHASPPQKVPHIRKISLSADPSYLDRFKSNPFSQMTSYMLETYSPDQALYNALFEAAMNRKDSVDISGFALTPKQVMDTASTLYEQAGMHLYYVSFIKWSKDYKSINFRYNDTADHIPAVQSRFYQQMNHLLYNVAPEHYSDEQRFFAVYDYISRYANYTDDMTDPTTHTAHSILTNGMAVCGGFAALFDLVLHHIGVPSEYVSNVAHAWNIVELGGERYHTDLTWGAGYKDGMESTLRFALMNDEKRAEGLTNAGLNDDPAIVGFPRDNPVSPAPVTDNRYQFLSDMYGNYALDIDNGWIYYSTMENIERMKLDGTGRETVSNQTANHFAYYDDTLYFSGTDPKTLYKMKDGAEPTVLDQSMEIQKMTMHDGILYYGDTAGKGKKLDLNTFSTEGFNSSNTTTDAALMVQAGSTFSMQIVFDAAMNAKVLPKDKIGLLTEAGKSLPLHMFWSEDRRTLTLRSKSSAVFDSEVSLYVAAGIETAAGAKTKENRVVQIEVKQQKS